MSVESHKVFESERGCCPNARDRAKIANQVYELAVECGISSVFKLDIKSDVIKTLTRLNRIKNADASADAIKPPEIQRVKAEGAGQEERT
ncbi:MAG: hypothetical protein LBT08_06150, partial [Synergistaceae bacterium]|jgi:hypothetical protein|nr:hypothetical protein [Synergistaceae bacterium]